MRISARSASKNVQLVGGSVGIPSDPSFAQPGTVAASTSSVLDSSLGMVTLAVYVWHSETLKLPLVLV